MEIEKPIGFSFPFVTFRCDQTPHRRRVLWLCGTARLHHSPKFLEDYYFSFLLAAYPRYQNKARLSMGFILRKCLHKLFAVR